MKTRILLENLRHLLHGSYARENHKFGVYYDGIEAIVSAEENSEAAWDYLINHVGRKAGMDIRWDIAKLFMSEKFSVERLISHVERNELISWSVSPQSDGFVLLKPIELLKLRLAWDEVVTFQTLIRLERAFDGPGSGRAVRILLERILFAIEGLNP